MRYNGSKLIYNEMQGFWRTATPVPSLEKGYDQDTTHSTPLKELIINVF